MKYCAKCDSEKTLDEFGSNKSSSDGKQRYCKLCQRAHVRKHYENNKQYYKDKSKVTSSKYRELVLSLKDVPCLDCGNRYPSYVMEFDHRDPKEKSFCLATGHNKSLDKLLAEVDKCDVVCANCHRIRTFGNMA